MKLFFWIYFAMVSHLVNQINLLRQKSYVDNEVANQFLQRIGSGEKLLQKENPSDHFCSFMVPLNRKTKSIYMGHHIKANLWIPPGGHIEPGETPVQTIKREFLEELGYRLTNNKIELFDLGVTLINNPSRRCKVHYDLWYIVEVKKIDFIFDKAEFYDARWFEIDKAIDMVKNYYTRRELNKLAKYFFEK